MACYRTNRTSLSINTGLTNWLERSSGLSSIRPNETPENAVILVGCVRLAQLLKLANAIAVTRHCRSHRQLVERYAAQIDLKQVVVGASCSLERHPALNLGAIRYWNRTGLGR